MIFFVHMTIFLQKGLQHRLPGQHDYKVAVIQKDGIDIPDPEKVKWQGFACIPLPTEYTRPS